MRTKKHSFIISILAICFVFSLASLALAADKPIVSTLKHKEAGLQCVDCHNTDNPTEKPNHSACIGCHDSGNNYYAGETRTYNNAGKPRQFNMHDSHQGPVRCTICHTVHKKPKEPMHCNWCHQIEVKVK